jgi:hypothetical protein
MIALFIAWGVFALAVVVRVILEAGSSSDQAMSDDGADERALEAITLSVF